MMRQCIDDSICLEISSGIGGRCQWKNQGIKEWKKGKNGREERKGKRGKGREEQMGEEEGDGKVEINNNKNEQKKWEKKGRRKK